MTDVGTGSVPFLPWDTDRFTAARKGKADRRPIDL
jgi:hypothetical protein